MKIPESVMTRDPGRMKSKMRAREQLETARGAASKKLETSEIRAGSGLKSLSREANIL